MKRILACLLASASLFSLAACGAEALPVTETETDGLFWETEQTETSEGGFSSGSSATDLSSSAVSSQDPATDGNSDGSDTSSETTLPEVGWDTEISHKVIMDDSGSRILIADLDLCGDGPEDIVIEDCIVWEWDSARAKGAALQGQDLRIDEALLRYSAYWDRDVVLFSGSGGWVGILDYETKEVLFEDKPGNGPHSVELLPNGDLIVACSGNDATSRGEVLHYPLSEGSTSVGSRVSLVSAHGVCWDPENEVIWALGDTEIIACVLRDGKISQVSGMGASLKSIGKSGGHDLTPVYGQPGKYWVTGSKGVYQFDAETETVSSSYSRATGYQGTNVKGIAWFPDGTMIQTAHGQGGTDSYRSASFKILYLGYTEGRIKQITVKTRMVPHREGSQTYKIHTLSKDYQ